MKKTPNLFQRDASGRNILPGEYHPDALWVVRGEGVATAKYDGTACLVRGGQLFKRYDAKRGKTPPPAFEPCQPDPDPVTGHHPGWLPVGDEPESKWHMSTWRALSAPLADGTYELCGPKFQGNPHGYSMNHFVRHGQMVLAGVPTEAQALREYLATIPYESVVWHGENGDLVKIRRHDFALPWPVLATAT